MITLITLTGGRPELFKLLEKFVARQTYKGPMSWLVVDDCQPATVCTMGQHYIKGPRTWEPGVNTQRFNMEAALSAVAGQYVFILEDDDYYRPTYIDTMLRHLQQSDAVGVGNAKYYHVGVPGYKYLRNYVHAALSMTAFNVKLLPILKAAVNSGEFYFDAYFWRRVMDTRESFTIINNTNISVGFKGLPGRSGLTHSHREKKDYLYDAGHAKLKSWLGVDYGVYEPYLRKTIKSVGVHNAANIQRP